jgi:uncharacterized protein (TIGR02996 family)
MARKALTTAAEAFLRAICEEPDEDAHRLVYADWLDENGDPVRAEFIRVQCALDRLGPYDEARFDLEARQQALFDAHRPDWLDELPRWARPPRTTFFPFRRGFLDWVGCTARQWLSGADALLRRVPLARASLERCKGLEGEVARCPHLGRLSELGLNGPEGPAVVRRLADAPLTRLTALGLHRCCVRGEEIDALARLSCLPRVARLSLSYNHLTDPAAVALAAVPGLSGLAELDLTGGYLGVAGAEALASPPHLGRLQRLTLTANRLGMEGARRLAASRTLMRLTHLDLGGANGLRTEGVAALASSLLIEGLTCLRLAYADLYETAVQALAATPRPTCLQELELRSVPVGDRGAEALAASPVAATLCVLGLAHSGVGPEGALALASSPRLARLQVLRLDGCCVGDAGARVLAGSPNLARLRRLTVSAEGLSGQARGRLRERFGDKVWS